MKRHEATIFDFTKDADDMLLMASHEGNMGGLSIHCTNNGLDGFAMRITKEQAIDLIRKLQQGIINLEVYEKCHAQKNNPIL